MTTKFYVYKITNKKNGKIYIGKSKDPEKRWRSHIYTVKYGEKKYGFSYIHQAIKYYGVENFLFEIIESCNNELLSFEREMFWIAALNSNNRDYGYNLTNGGEGGAGRVMSEEEKITRSAKAIAANRRGINSKNYGRKLTEEHKKKISESNKGKVMSEEAKTKISMANSGENNGRYGKPASFATRGKIKSASKNKVRKPHTPKTLQLLSDKTINRDPPARIPDETKKNIIDLYNQGSHTKKQISDITGVKFHTVSWIIRRKDHKLYPNIIPQEIKDKVLELVSSGITSKKIAGKLNISIERVNTIRRGPRNR